MAHEIKNPLTPIALSADRIARQLERSAPPEPRGGFWKNARRRFCAKVESVTNAGGRVLAIRRFPAAQPVPST
jgi:two-component system nitrogen regulation sensor histidine kinase NtrY